MKSLLKLALFLFGFILAFGQKGIEKDRIKYYDNLLNYPQSDTDIFNAINFFTEQKEKHSELNDTLNVISDLRRLAIGQHKLGFHSESEVLAVEAIELLSHLPETTKTREAYTGLYNQLGRNYKAMLDFDRSIECYDKALLYAEDDVNKNIIRNNKAVIYKDHEKYELAETEFQLVYNNSLEHNDVKQRNRALDNLAFVQTKLGKDGALEQLEEALESRLKNNDLTGAYSSYRHLSIYYQDRNDLIQAKRYADKALATAKIINSPTYILNAMELQMQTKNDSLALAYKILRDSLANAEQQQKNSYALIKFNYYEQEQKANEQLLKAEQERRKKQWFQAAGLLLVVASIPLFLFLNVRYKRKTLLKVYETEGKISKKVHDEVANDVYRMMAKMQSEEVSKEHTLDDLELIYRKTRDISKSIDPISESDDFSHTLKDLMASYQSEKVSVVVQGLNSIDLESLDNMRKVALYRVLQELLTNTKKHAEASLVVLKFAKENRKLKVSYLDNGLGCDLKKGNGLHNTENRIKDINGTITFETTPEKGFRSTIIL
ncbi:tetratricopeptide repeat-containing sensor histidine kinase [Aegicerativicinus sediminis]|uniref:tetratricopeptide repeat-containing sensor histidine kinase n=1 Tax=Aegicerativicinus sediminis TaxID=2893202 RepID=UPI001E46F90C|nr:tetratricopeptide repeat protein [Aegicerativicinus sediminis]